MKKILNFRTLADGLKNRSGAMIPSNVIFRSGDISHASQSDLELLGDRGIQTIYDLRSKMEMGKYTPTERPSFKIKHVEIMKDALQNNFRALVDNSKSQNEEFMLDMYAIDFIEADGFNELIKEIISREDDAFLFHCTAGKDRTGILGAILMMILDFDIKSINEEYLRMNRHLATVIAHRISEMLGVAIEKIPKNLEPLFLVENSYINAFTSSIDNKYGSINNYYQNQT